MSGTNDVYDGSSITLKYLADTIQQNQALNFYVQAEDPEEGPAENEDISLGGGEDVTKFSKAGSQNGVSPKTIFRITADPTYDPAADFDGDNEYNFTVRAFGQNSNDLNVSLTLLKPNSISDLVSGVANYDVDISDDGDTIGFINNGTASMYEYINDSWSQKGETVNNNVAGQVISLNSDGTVIALGSESDCVDVMQYSNGSWSQLGSAICGSTIGSTNNDELFSGGLQLNNAGDIIIAGFKPSSSAPENAQIVIKAFQIVSGEWEQMGQDIASYDPDNFAAGMGALAMDSTGTIIAVGEPGNDANGNSSGQVKIYEYTGNPNTAGSYQWSQKGASIGDSAFAAASNQFGMALSMSGDGTTLAVISDDQQASPNLGRIIIYKWNGTNYDTDGWIFGKEGYRFNNGSVALSNDGTRIAVTSIGATEDNLSGYTQIFYYSGENSFTPSSDGSEWTAHGPEFSHNENNGRAGWRNASGINASGTRAVIGIPANALPAGNPEVRVIEINAENPNSGNNDTPYSDYN